LRVIYAGHGVRREEDCGLLQELLGQLLGLRCQPHSLMIVEQDALVLFLLFLQDSVRLSTSPQGGLHDALGPLGRAFLMPRPLGRGRLLCWRRLNLLVSH
jgi:hypothetical protein